MSDINTGTLYNSPLVCEGSGDSMSYINTGTLYNSPLVCVGPGESESLINTSTVYNSHLICDGPGDSTCMCWGVGGCRCTGMCALESGKQRESAFNLAFTTVFVFYNLGTHLYFIT